MAARSLDPLVRRALVLALATACQPGRDATRLPEDARSILIGLESVGDGHLTVIGVDPIDGAVPYASATQDRVTLIVYSSELASLGIARDSDGKVTPATGADPGRPLPIANALFAAEPGAPMVATDTISSALRRFRLPSFDLGACILSGGCFDPERYGSLCKTPCPDPPRPDAPALPAAVIPAALPMLPCPAGWTEAPPDPDTAVRACDPPAPPASRLCPAGEVQGYGESACTPLGTACPSGDWQAGLPVGTRYVKANAPPGGVGTMGAPFATIAEAINGAVGATIALSKGIFAESPVIDHPLVLIGACAAGTTIGAPVGSAIAVVSRGVILRDLSLVAPGPVLFQAGGSSVRVYGVAIHSGGERGWQIEPGAFAEADRVSIDGARFAGLQVFQASGRFHRLTVSDGESRGVLVTGRTASATIDRLVVRRIGASTQPIEDHAVSVLDGGYLELHQVEVSGAAHNGVAAIDRPSRLVIEDATISAISGDPDQYDGIALEIHRSEVHGARIAIADFAAIGIQAVGTATASLEDVHLNGAPDPAAPVPPIAVDLWNGARLELRRTQLSRATKLINIHDPHTRLTLEDGWLHDAVDFPLGAENGVDVTLHRLAIQRCGRGIWVTRAHADLADLTVFGNYTGTSSSAVGDGLVIESSTVSVVRASIEKQLSGLVMVHGSVVEGSDLELRGLPETEWRQAVGIVQVGSRSRLERVHVADCRKHGMFISGAGESLTATVSDLSIERVELSKNDGGFGQGIWGELTARLRFERVRIASVDDSAMTLGRGCDVLECISAVLSDVTVEGAKSALCAEAGVFEIHRAAVREVVARGLLVGRGLIAKVSDLSVERSPGFAISAAIELGYSGRERESLVRALTLSRFSIDGAGGTGFRLAPTAGPVDIRDGEVSSCGIGVQTPYERVAPFLFTRVRFRDVGVAIDGFR